MNKIALSFMLSVALFYPDTFYINLATLHKTRQQDELKMNIQYIDYKNYDWLRTRENYSVLIERLKTRIFFDIAV